MFVKTEDLKPGDLIRFEFGIQKSKCEAGIVLSVTAEKPYDFVYYTISVYHFKKQWYMYRMIMNHPSYAMTNIEFLS